MSTISRRDFLKALGASAAALAMPMAARAASGEKLNVLFIAVDDLRPQLGCYGDARIISPNIDKLAARGLLFERAYCQQAICMATRASLMSGYRPDEGKIYQCGPLYKAVPGALTINKHFMAHGYETITIGKVYHHAGDEAMGTGWSAPAWHPKGAWEGRGYLDKESIAIVRGTSGQKRKDGRTGMGPAYEHPDVPDGAYQDGMIADRAIGELNRLKDKPFFLAVGFAKPHLPFCAPKKYWDLYDHAKIELPDNPYLPKDAPKCALTSWGELRGYAGMPAKGNMPDDLARNLIHSYFACISYMDAQLGRVLDELDRLGLREKTAIVLWGDHGWKLGEHSMWCKHTNFELDTHAALIMSAPGMKAAGKKTRALTEFLDIYPTLCEVCGLPQPGHLEGTSAAPLLDNPELKTKDHAISQYPSGKLMGYSLRTERYRYTEWRVIETGAVEARELYDHEKDPGENVNVAGDPANKELIGELGKTLRDNYHKKKA